MTRRILSIAALFGVLASACGKYGPPIRLRAEAASVESSATSGGTHQAETDEESEPEGKRP